MNRALQQIARLRRLALDEARRDLGACLQAQSAAEDDAREAELTLQREQQAAAAMDAGDGAVEAFATWLPHGCHAAAEARARAERAATASAQARARLALAKGALEAVETMLERRAEEARLEALRREQLVLDEIGGRRRR